MTLPHPQLHVCPTGTVARYADEPLASDPFADDPYRIPLLRLRSHDRPRITPETCRMPHCPICAWMREGLLDDPRLRRAA